MEFISRLLQVSPAEANEAGYLRHVEKSLVAVSVLSEKCDVFVNVLAKGGS